MIPLHDNNPTRRHSWVTLALIAACCAVYFLVQPVGRAMVGYATNASSCADARFNLDHAAIPYELSHLHALAAVQRARLLAATGCPVTGPLPPKNIWESLLATMFLHASLLHLGGNMLFLWIFGNNIEDRFGRLRYLAFYLAAGVVATAVYVASDPNSGAPLIGASGAIAGVMGAYLVLFPGVRIKTLFIIVIVPLVFDIRAFWLLAFWLASQFLVSPSSGVAWTAHVGGFVFGMLVGLGYRAGTASRRRTPVAW
jgi:membrane associated rhomboid family serine protease